MRRLMMYGIVVPMLFTTLISCAPQQEKPIYPADPPSLLVNGSFERGSGQKPENWVSVTWSGEGEGAWVQEGHGGGGCVRLTSAKGGDVSWAQTVAVKPETQYRLSAWIRTDNVVPGSAKGALVVAQEVGAPTPAVSDTQDWTHVHCVLNSGDHDSIKILCSLGGWGLATGTAWFDDVRLEEIGSSPNQSDKTN